MKHWQHIAVLLSSAFLATSVGVCAQEQFSSNAPPNTSDAVSVSELEELGRQYNMGEGVPVDRAKAISFFYKALTNGSTYAYEQLAADFFEFEIVRLGYDNIVEFYRHGIEIKAPGALMDMGRACYYGSRTDVDYRVALECFKKASESGSPEEKEKAREYVGFMYAQGKGTDQDLEKAEEWLRDVPYRTHGGAYESGGFRCHVGFSYVHSIPDWYERHCRLFDCRILPRDLSKAVEWYTKSAEQDGSTFSMLELMRMQRHGDKGVPADLAKSYKWAILAADKGETAGLVQLEREFAEKIIDERSLSEALVSAAEAADKTWADLEQPFENVFENHPKLLRRIKKALSRRKK